MAAKCQKFILDLLKREIMKPSRFGLYQYFIKLDGECQMKLWLGAWKCKF